MRLIYCLVGGVVLLFSAGSVFAEGKATAEAIVKEYFADIKTLEEQPPHNKHFVALGIKSVCLLKPEQVFCSDAVDESAAAALAFLDSDAFDGMEEKLKARYVSVLSIYAFAESVAGMK
jgi:hypothetical protein